MKPWGLAALEAELLRAAKLDVLLPQGWDGIQIVGGPDVLDLPAEATDLEKVLAVYRSSWVEIMEDPVAFASLCMLFKRGARATTPWVGLVRTETLGEWDKVLAACFNGYLLRIVRRMNSIGPPIALEADSESMRLAQFLAERLFLYFEAVTRISRAQHDGEVSGKRAAKNEFKAWAFDMANQSRQATKAKVLEVLGVPRSTAYKAAERARSVKRRER